MTIINVYCKHIPTQQPTGINKVNNQPPLIAGQLLGLFFVVGFVYFFFKAKAEAEQRKYTCYGPTFTIGHIVEEPMYDKDFYNDCRDSLVAVGYKKSYANKLTQQIFDNSVPSDITSFLSKAMKEQHAK